MFNFRKVKPVEEGSKNKNQEDQKNYEKKVEALQNACDNFGEYLEKEVNEGTKFVDIAKAFADKDTGFGNQMKKSWLLSRTSRRLNEMKKNLSKSKSKTFDPQKIDDFVKCFEFEREKLNNKGNIKRSAIDDKKVYDFFNENSKGSIREILSVKQKEAQKESGELNKRVSIALDQADESLDASKKARDEATGVQKEIAQTRTSVKSDKKIEPKTKRESMTSLNGQIGELGQDKSESQQAAQDLIEKQKETKKIMKDENSTPRERMGSLNKLRKATVANNAATDELNGAVDKAEEVHAEVEKDIEEAKADLFDEKTGTFTIRTEADFEKIKDFKNEIKNVVVGEGITTIKDGAFYFCDSLASIDLGNVTTIGDSAFHSCDSLASINLGNVTTIGYLAFYHCEKLESVNLSKVKIIIDKAFLNCKALTSVDLSNVTAIGESAFGGCRELKSVVFGNNVKIISKSAFDSCQKLENVVFGNNVETIREFAFRDCKELESVDLSNVDIIEERAFSGCEKLESVVFGNNVKTIRESAFSGCKELESVVFRGSVDTIGDKAFSKCSSLKTIILPKDNNKAADVREKMLKQIGEKDIKFINDLEDAYSFDEETKIFTIKTENGFSGSIQYKTKIKKIIMEESIETVKNLAFKCCTALTSVNLSNVTTIEDQSFFGCKELESVDLSKVETIGDKAFNGCKKLKEIDLSNITTIGRSAFFGCSSLNTVILPKDNTKAADVKEKILKQIGEKDIKFINDLEDAYSFDEETKIFTVKNENGFSGSIQYKAKIQKIIMEESIETVKNSAFKGCEALESVDLSKVKTIGASAFNGCKKLTNVNLGNVTAIGATAFLNCEALTSVDLANNVETIGASAFNGCKKLGKIDLSNLSNITAIGNGTFANCEALERVNLGNNVKTIGATAFQGCKKLEEIDLSNVTTIRRSAFYECSNLKTVTLPQDGEKAKEIRDIICKQTKKTAGDGNNNTIEFVNDPEPAAATQKK